MAVRFLRLVGRTRETVRLAALSASMVVALAMACTGDKDGGSGDFSSRFPAIHTFGTDDYHSLAFSLGEDGVVLFGHHGGVQKSNDEGASWQIVIDEAGRDAMNLVYDPFSPDIIYMAGFNGEVQFFLCVAFKFINNYCKVYVVVQVFL